MKDSPRLAELTTDPFGRCGRPVCDSDYNLDISAGFFEKIARVDSKLGLLSLREVASIFPIS